MNPILDLKNLLPRETFEAMLASLGGEALQERLGERRRASAAMNAAVGPEHRALFLRYTDAVGDSDALREEAAVQAGLSLGLGLGVALHAYPDQEAGALARVAVDVVASLLTSEAPLDQAQDVARQVLRALARLTAEPAGI